MNALEYLREKAIDGNEWTRRTPRETHPTIVALVREAKTEAGLFYDDDVNRYVVERIPGAWAFAEQLGHEVYIAKGTLNDEQAQARLDALTAEGFEPATAESFEHGASYVVTFGTVYVGRTIAEYGQTYDVRAKRVGSQLVLLPPKARTQGYAVREPMLAKRA